jgi:catechol 2,3-dioxygenase-like lactoylglutathione lyase family enzyme
MVGSARKPVQQQMPPAGIGDAISAATILSLAEEQAMTRRGPVPGVAGIEHIGLIVPDLDAATEFLADVLGAEALYDVGPFPGHEDWMAGHLAGATGAHIHRMRMLAVANGPAIELIELIGAKVSGGESSPAPAGWHIAFYVDDMDAALAALKAHDCKILSGPVSMTEGPSAGLTWLYFRAPWGQQLELVSYPGGIAAYRDLGRKVWRPASAAAKGR